MNNIYDLISKGLFRDAAAALYEIERQEVKDENDIAQRLSPWAYKQTEHFLVVTLDPSLHIINVYEISKGGLDRVVAHPREVFRPAILDNAASIVIAHNHPSGELVFSEQDIDITHKMAQAGEMLGIPVIDSYIVSPKGFINFGALEEGGENEEAIAADSAASAS